MARDVAAASDPARTRRALRGLRLGSAVASIGLWGALVATWPAAEERALPAYASLMTLGYGHFLGAGLRARAGPTRGARTAFSLVGLAWLFLLFQRAVAAWGPQLAEPLFPLLLGASYWHVAENELALGRAARRGTLRIGPLPPDAGLHALALGVAAAGVALSLEALALRPFSNLGTLPPADGARSVASLAGMAAALVARRPGARAAGCAVACAAALPLEPLARAVSFADLFFLVMLYHFALWLGLTWTAAAPGRRRALALRLGLSHAPPALLAVLAFLPLGFAPTLQHLLFAPFLYLFWSLAHIAGTALRRGIGRPEPSAERVSA